jgi:hypothetical protein
MKSSVNIYYKHTSELAGSQGKETAVLKDQRLTLKLHHCFPEATEIFLTIKY